MKKVFIFDVDGVLMHSFVHEPKFKALWTETLKEDLSVCPEALSTLFFSESWERVVTGELSVERALAEFLPTVGYVGDVELFIRYWLEKDSRVNRELVDMLKPMAADDSVRLCIATNQEHRRMEYLLGTLGFGDIFDDVFYSADIGYTKSDPRFYKEVDARLGEVATPIFFDDTQKVVDAACAHGWDARLFVDVSSVAQALKP